METLGARQVAILVSLLLLSQMSHAQKIVSTVNEQNQLSVTVFNNDLALIKDQRQINVPPGEVLLEFQDVSEQIKPETTVFSAINSHQKVALKELNFDYDILTPENLLKKHVGENINVEIRNPVTGEKRIEPAKVLSVTDGVILQFSDRIVAGQEHYTYIYRRLPEDLHSKPTLSLLLENRATEVTQVELTYLTQGLSWNADYVARLNDSEDRLAINGWVTLSNNSGIDYNNANLQLVSGEVNVVQDDLVLESPRKFIANVAEARREEIPAEKLLDYHIYNMERSTTIRSEQKKQVALLSASELPVKKQYVLESRGYWNYAKDPSPKRKQPVSIWLEFENSESNEMGQPLPAGVVRVYKNDLSGRAQFVGEDKIEHISLGEQVRLNVGEAYDVKAQRFQSRFKLMPSNTYNSVSEVENTVILQNSRDEDVLVVIRETMFGEWEILEESHKNAGIEGNVVQWIVAVPAKDEVEHKYSVRVRY